TMKRTAANESAENADNGSRLRQWPVQIRLAPPTAAFYQDADLLIAADCTAYAYGRFHQDFIRDRIVLIGCPKLDDTDYSLKLTDILAKNEIRSVTVVRMEVPCCGGISYAAEKAVARCGKKLPMQIITIGTDGEICR
ncbi:MAG: ferredoxin, partial [Clostridia bacterium]|nr:ferredoxin [Clostridia bacterium]